MLSTPIFLEFGVDLDSFYRLKGESMKVKTKVKAGFADTECGNPGQPIFS